VGQPASCAGNGEDRRKEVAGDAELAVNQPRIEVNVGENALGAQPISGHGLQTTSHVVHVVVAETLEQFFGQPLQDDGPGILDPVFAVSKAHDFLLLVDGPIQPGVDLLHRANLVEHVEHILVGAAMQRARQGADRRGHHRIGVGEGAGGDPGAERTGVETVFGVENQAGIKDAGRQGVRFPLGEHVEKIGAIGQIIAGLNRILAFANQLKSRHHGGNLGDQPNHRIDDVLRVVEGATRIEES